MAEDSSYDLSPLQTAVQMLTRLLEMLYAEISPDILTAYDVSRRYRLTGLGRPAVAAISQAQRIVRRSGSYEQMGLCEFHTGLIYLNWGRCSMAREQFAAARYQWQLSNETAPSCLSYFAEGQAYHHGLQFEQAMSKYSKAEQMLPRIHLVNRGSQSHLFMEKLQEAIRGSQDALREVLWPGEEGEGADAASTAGGSGPTTAVDDHTHPKEAEPGVNTEQTTPHEAPVKRPGVAQPIVNISNAPLPGHQRVNSQYAWYQVEELYEHFLPTIAPDTWLLVNTDTVAHQYKKNELVVVLKPNVEEGAILLRQDKPQRPFGRIYLAKSRLEGQFVRDFKTGAVELSSHLNISVEQNEILGIVVGIWQAYPV